MKRLGARGLDVAWAPASFSPRVLARIRTAGLLSMPGGYRTVGDHARGPGHAEVGHWGAEVED